MKLQTEEWLPTIEWFCNTMGVTVQPTNSISLPLVPAETKDVVMRYLMSHSFVALHGMSNVTMNQVINYLNSKVTIAVYDGFYYFFRVQVQFMQYLNLIMAINPRDWIL